MLSIKRAYLPAEEVDGHRVLVDRLWPRGVKRTDLNIDEWLKDVAPSTELRKWFDHRSDRWLEFSASYRAELQRPEQAAEVSRLADLAAGGVVTLIYGARSETENHAVVLKSAIDACHLKRR